MGSKVLIFSAFVAAFFVSAVNGQEQPLLSDICLGCICEAVSGCNTTVGCAGDICGPFHITWGYWSDSGKPTLGGSQSSNDYASCANDARCAARAVEGYMTKYKQDCDGNGRIDCDDYMRIHYLGGYGCTGSWLPANYQQTYSNCMRSFSQ